MPPRGTFPALLLVEEKQSTSYFHIPDEATLHAVALSILTARLTSGDWYFNPEENEPPDPIDYDALKIPELPATLRGIAEDNLAEHEKIVREYKHDCEQFAATMKAVQEKDGAAAWTLIQARDGYEYEAVKLVAYTRKYHT